MKTPIGNTDRQIAHQASVLGDLLTGIGCIGLVFIVLVGFPMIVGIIVGYVNIAITHAECIAMVSAVSQANAHPAVAPLMNASCFQTIRMDSTLLTRAIVFICIGYWFGGGCGLLILRLKSRTTRRHH